VSIEVRPAYYTGCDFCGEMWGPYRDKEEAKYEPTLDGWRWEIEIDGVLKCSRCIEDEDEE